MSPNSRPSAHTPRPPISSVRPFQPRNVTVERSGTTRLASPAAWVACSARAGAAWPASATPDVTPIAATSIPTTIRRLTNFCTVSFILPRPRKSTIFGSRVLRSTFWVLVLGSGSTGTRRAPGENDGLYSELLYAVVGQSPAHARGQGHSPG